MLKEGVKFDKQKTRWDLLPLTMLKQVVDVLTFGSNKYSDNNWKMIPDAKARYFSAMMRHLEKWQSGEKCDEESGYSHLAHACCCLLFILWFDDNESNIKAVGLSIVDTMAPTHTTAHKPMVVGDASEY